MSRTVRPFAWQRVCRLLVTVILCAVIAGNAVAADTEVAKQDPIQNAVVEVAVYGGTPAGIAAALAAGRQGHHVLLIEPYRHIGGLVTNGLSHADFRTFEALTGTYRDLTRRVQAHYNRKYGPESPEAQGCFQGTHAEPHINEIVFEQMLAEVPTIRVEKRWRLSGVELQSGEAGQSKILSAKFQGPDGTESRVQAAIFIDATYEGDLMALAKVPYRVGRESAKEYGESLAPPTEDRQVQGYNFRLIMTQDPKNRVLPTAPEGYRREEFLPLVPLLEAGKFEKVFVPKTGGIYKAHRPLLPHGKYDINDVSRGLVRLSLPDLSADWPDGDAKTRDRIFAEHVRHNTGLLYFLQNDEAVPEKFRDEARKWGWCRDEFADTGHIPEQLYIREARRMVGQYVFKESDTDYAPNDARSVLRKDAIAMGDYGPNCHGTAHEGPRIGGHHTGEFYKKVAPYQIPYGVLVPKDCENLLVPVACSASHVGFCALRLEPIWTSLGQAAGFAAHVSLDKNLPVQSVPVGAVQHLLHKHGAATIYVSDVPPDSEDFAAVQWWGTQGGLHGLEPAPKTPGERGELITSQYYKAYPGHAAKLDQPLTAELREAWSKLAKSLGLQAKDLEGVQTRGDFIRRAYSLHQKGNAPKVGVVGDGTPQFKITTQRDNDRVDVKFENDKVIFSVHSPFGISQVVIAPAGTKWPDAVMLRLHLKGLENFKVTNGKVTLEGSASLQNGKPMIRLWKDGQEDSTLDNKSPFWIDVRFLDGNGKPAKEIPLKDGYFELPLPKTLFEDNPKITLGWIDFYRN